MFFTNYTLVSLRTPNRKWEVPEIKKAGEGMRLMHIKPWECCADDLMPHFLRVAAIFSNENIEQ